MLRSCPSMEGLIEAGSEILALFPVFDVKEK
jgi:hypothetical protein